MMLETLAAKIDALNCRVGSLLSWLSLAMVLLTAINVAMRYLFHAGEPWQAELVLFFHSILFLGVMGYALQTGDQVRVDVFYTTFSKRAKAWVDMLGAIFLLLPLCAALVYYASGYVAASWALHEASPEYHGMHGVWLLKTMLILGPALLGFQGVAMAIRALIILRSSRASA